MTGSARTAAVARAIPDAPRDIVQHFELLRYQRADYHDDMEAAFTMMEAYIVEHQITLVGGMAMDFALRLKNTKLYNEDAIPDYDCLSPTHVLHAYGFANQLCKRGFRGVEVIRALHVTTMRVRINGQYIMDCTYIPTTLQKRLLHLEYRGMKTIHPWHSMLDQMNAIAHPFSRPPTEALMERLAKDNTRFALLYKYYPFDSKNIVLRAARAVPDMITTSTTSTTRDIKKLVPLDDYCVSGYAALAYHLPNPMSRVVDLEQLKFSMPVDEPVHVHTRQIAMLNVAGTRYFHGTMEQARYALLPAGVRVYDVFKRIITVDERDPRFVSYQFLTLSFMSDWLFSGNAHSFHAVKLLVDHAMSTHPHVSIKGYGTRSIEDSFIANIESFRNPAMRTLVPGSYTYREHDPCTKTVEFDYTSKYFQIDGSETTKFEPELQADIELRCGQITTTPRK